MKTFPKGFLLALEGLDGSGKSTQARLVAESLRHRGIEASSFREPTEHSEWGRILRGGDSGPKARKEPGEELDLFMKDRAWDVGNNILPVLRAGGTALMDRYVLSSVSYQGALGIPPREILAANAAFPWPDLTIVLDLDPEEGLGRIREGRGKTDGVFENAKYLAKVREVLSLAVGLPGVRFVNAQIAGDELSETIVSMAVELMRRKRP
ncbi:MAG: dTMP kinase [Deltaproteobacteria bacterium]|nr:dTMP kinase [Deltaproteobacteria bacterium]